MWRCVVGVGKGILLPTPAFLAERLAKPLTWLYGKNGVCLRVCVSVHTITAERFELQYSAFARTYILGRRYASRSLRVTGFAHLRWSAPVTAATTTKLPSYLGLRRFRLGPPGLASEFSVANFQRIRIVSINPTRNFSRPSNS